MSSVVETLFRFIEATSSRQKDWQIASAVALGVLCGLLPYTSLLPALLLAFAFFVPFHASLFLGTALVAAVSTSSIQYLLAPVGEWTLSIPIVLNQVLKVNALPLGSWLRLNNTVVNGALVVGLVQFIPTYAAVRTFCYVFRPSRQRTDPDFQVEETPSISYIDVGSEIFQEVEETPDFSLESIPELERGAEGDEPGAPMAKVESFLADVREGNQHTSPKSIAERASELAELVDEMLDDLQEVEHSPSGKAPGIQKLHASHTAGPNSANHLEEPLVDTGKPTSQSETIGGQANDTKLMRADKSHVDGVSIINEPTSGLQVSQHEEALRYLLHHLKEIKDKA